MTASAVAMAAGQNIGLATVAIPAGGMGRHEFTFSLAHKAEAARAARILRAQQRRLGFSDISVELDVGTIAVQGVGLLSHPEPRWLFCLGLTGVGVSLNTVCFAETCLSADCHERLLLPAVRELTDKFGLRHGPEHQSGPPGLVGRPAAAMR